MIAMAVMTPSSLLCRKAAAMSTPSTKLWIVSPTTISVPLRPWSCAAVDGGLAGSCTSQCSVWQWRQRSSFSSTKKTKMPPRMAVAAWCGSPASKAWGMTSRNAAPSSAPIAYDTSIGTHAARSSSAIEAMPAESAPPAMLATTIQPRVIEMTHASWGGRILREPHHGGHARARSLAPEGEEALLFGIGAEIPAIDARNTQPAQALASHRVEVEQPVPRAVGDEGHFGSGIAREKRVAHLRADLIDARTDRGAEPREQGRGRDAHRPDGGLDDA